MLYARVRELLVRECIFFAQCSSGGQVLRPPGVTASIVPAAPLRSMFNWVIFDHLDALAVHYSTLAAAYDAAGVRAWTVWVDPGDQAACDILTDRGHVLDSQPAAMAAEMGDLKLPPVEDLDWSETRDLDLIGRINDAAYGFPPPAFAAVMQRWPESPWHAYVARLNDEPVATVMTHNGSDGDCGVTAVATLPVARGHGIAGRLLAAALGAARAGGAVTTSLQASPTGKRVYAALGYRDLGTMGMWERRDEN